MSRAGICLEAVDVAHDPPVAAESAWILPDALNYLLDLLTIDPTHLEYVATDQRATPDFSWWMAKYSHCEHSHDARPDEWVLPHPPRELCVNPTLVLQGLRWLRDALDVEDSLKREQFWRWFRPGEPFNPSRFAEPFTKDLEAWCSLCQRAEARGLKVVLRVDD